MGASSLDPKSRSEISIVICERCEGDILIRDRGSCFYVVSYGHPEGFVCRDCASTAEDRALLGIELLSLITGFAPEPSQGAFHPLDEGTYSGPALTMKFWLELAESVIQTLGMWHGKVLRFNLSGLRYKGLWIKPTWVGSEISELLIAGDDPSKKLELDVYQTTRLSKLGYVEEGETEKTWRLELSRDERGISNITSVMVHTMRFGYLLEPTDLNTLTPIVDIDKKSPEYLNRKSKRKK